MRTFAILGLLAGFAAAGMVTLEPRKAEPDPRYTPVTGTKCCSSEPTEDINNYCKNVNLTAYCCSNIRSDQGTGCDGGIGWTTGRLIQMTRWDSRSACKAANRFGFIGCV
ncbi:hypothetical protein PgNI_10923 [Pyricularia grisea]|uniref:Hydrophobin-like protein n=1 Tax=Pyricularia grisea TaxID=148305 RepID=A0A6P8AXP0_PYRGI|nr:hypothetical protein PgNI_10923 [Pyricularia grisea]TLD07054.1 hypothetical protein PgNI_10923 [Pyricularia grisea]